MPEGDKFVSFTSRREQARQKLQIGVTAAQLARANRLSLQARQIPILLKIYLEGDIFVVYDKS